VNALMSFLYRVYLYFYNLFIPPYATRFVEEALPQKLKRRVLYIGPGGRFSGTGGVDLSLRLRGCAAHEPASR
jgi:hypothetical protein